MMRASVPLLAAVLLAAQPGAAQGVPYATLSFSATRSYEHNVFGVSSSRGPQSDFVWRVGPILEAGHMSPQRTLVARYAVAAEHFSQHAELNRLIAKQDASIGIEQRATRRLALGARASFVETHMPNELNTLTGLTLERARATRLSVGSTAAYEWSRRARLDLEYSFASDTLARGLSTAFHDVRIGMERKAADRYTARIGYRFQHLGSGERQSDPSHIVTVGWSRDVTRLMRVDVEAGPRITPDAVRPELSLVLRHRLRRGELSAAVANTRTPVIGERGLIDVQRVSAGLSYRPRRRVSLSAAPAFVRSTRGPLRVSAYMLEMDVVVDASRMVSLAASGRLGVQHGTLGGGRPEQVPYRSVSMNLVVNTPWLGRHRQDRRRARALIGSQD